MRYLRSVVLLAVAAALVVASACGSDTTAAAAPRRSPPAIKLPSKLLGLDVKTENISSRLEAQGQQPYIDSVGLFSFRQKNDLLQATLQVARFTPEARTDEAAFRGSIVSRIGGANPRVVRVGAQRVYLTSGRSQVVFIWFRKDGLFVLTVRSDYPFPRTILRELIDMDLAV